MNIVNVVRVCWVLCVANALIHHLPIKNDNRKRFLIENFGFDSNGELHMTVKNFEVVVALWFLEDVFSLAG